MNPLSSTQLAQVSRAQHVVLAPLAYPTPEAWMQAVSEELKRLFHAERSVFMLTLPTGPTFVTDLTATEIGSYNEHYIRTDVAPTMLEQLECPFAVEEDARGASLFDRYVTGEAFNDWYLAQHMNRSVSLRAYGRPKGVPKLTLTWSEAMVANVLLGSSSAARGKKAGPARTMLALLQPALSAAVRSLQQSARPSGFGSPHVSAVLNSLEVPAWLFDEAGRCIHQSAAASRLAARVAQGDVLRAGAEQLARALLRGTRGGLPVPSAWALELSGERVGLVGAHLRAEGSVAPAVLVRAEGVLPALPSGGVLRARFGLTPQEARVALLRARGEATAAIAERLSVSVHTVRRHTERVLAKLAIHRAAEIGPLLLALAPGGGPPASA